MNQEQVIGIVRIVVPFICALLASKIAAFGDATVVAEVTAVVIGLISVAWSVWSHTNANKIKSAASVDPGITIAVPAQVAAADGRVAAVVADPSVPNVTAKP